MIACVLCLTFAFLEPISGAVTCDSDKSAYCFVTNQTVSANEDFRILRTNGMPITDVILFNTVMPQLPTTIFTSYPNISFLSLSSNGLMQVSVKSFANAVKLKKLYIFDQPLTRITNGTFRSCTILEDLQITGCKVAVVEANAFLGISNLNSLSLSRNRITVLHPMLLASLPNLFIFYANENMIKKLSNQLFSKNPSLVSVSISGNQLTELPADLFQANKYLDSLDITDNLLTNIRTFGAKDVYLDSNRIKRLQLDSGLKKILMNNNFLEVIECANADLTTIDRVFLSNNSLQNLNCIRDMANLTELDVSENKLPRPTQAAFTKLQKMKILTMFNQTRFSKIAAKALSPLKSILILRLDRLVDYRNLRQLFPSLFMISLSTRSWNCSYVQRVVNALSRQKVRLNYNNVQDQQICNIKQV